MLSVRAQDKSEQVVLFLERRKVAEYLNGTGSFCGYRIRVLLSEVVRTATQTSQNILGLAA